MTHSWLTDSIHIAILVNFWKCKLFRKQLNKIIKLFRYYKYNYIYIYIFIIIIIFVIPKLNIYWCPAMSFIHDIYEFRKSFRHIENLTLRCVHLKDAIEYIYIYSIASNNFKCAHYWIPNEYHIIIYVYIYIYIYSNIYGKPHYLFRHR